MAEMLYVKGMVNSGQPMSFACDHKCHKAWGITHRPRRQLSENPDDFVYLADDEIPTFAPADPETYEGGDGKPAPEDTKPNKWCVRQCERGWISPRGYPDATPVLRDFVHPKPNIPRPPASKLEAAELDRWLAERVMGWTLWVSGESEPTMGLPIMCGHRGYGAWWVRAGTAETAGYDEDAWHPTATIAQAIEAADKAQADGRIEHYDVQSPCLPHLVQPRSAVYYRDTRSNIVRRQVDAATMAEAVCRALYGALTAPDHP